MVKVMTKLIKTWAELAEVAESETHFLDISVSDCNGWIMTKKPVGNKFSDKQSYLSTHTFYGSSHKRSTKLLQSCGFDVEIDNWDK
ncbi:hypothetical protein NVP1225O_30 [Vibrio phage 1.225.O._10N.261.48.B7]|nr:hypothetical protein NVP1225O_30 [Vibrio phage 1.225.O._10N.261.48.B7]